MHGNVRGTWMQSLRCSAPSREPAFLCLLRNAVGLTMVHVDNKGIVDGRWRSDMRCIGPRANDADLWIMIWEELHRFHQEGILVEVEHVKAHRTKKGMQQMSLFERFIAQGNEKADKFAKAGAMIYGGGKTARTTALTSTPQQTKISEGDDLHEDEQALKPAQRMCKFLAFRLAFWKSECFRPAQSCIVMEPWLPALLHM